MDPDAAAALASVDWSELLGSPNTPSTHRLLFHKLKGDQLSGWDRTNERCGCPHCPSIGHAGGTAFHIMWACPRAQERWQQLLDYWAPLYSIRRSLHDGLVKGDDFGLKLTLLPDRLWHLPEMTRFGDPTSHDTTATRLALTAVWRRHVLVTMHTIWRWRTEPDSAEEIWSEAQARARHGAGLHCVSHEPSWHRAKDSSATKFTAAALDVLFADVGTLPTASPQGPSPDDTFLLFFDGGARKNPGPGGSGAVVLRVDASATGAEVVWSSAMALGTSAQQTTNNQAEYHGLLTGLQETSRRGWTPWK